MIGRCALAIILGFYALAAGLPICARAEDLFYKNKTVTIVCPASVGDSYDLYARFVAAHLARFIPGNPRIVVENRPGAGSRTAAIHVFDNAPQDGTVIGNAADILPFDELIHPPEPGMFDMTKAQYLGNLVSLTGVIAVSKDAHVATLDDVKHTQVIIGANEPGSITYMGPMIINALSGTQFKIVGGYNGSAAIDLAIARGEVTARGGSWQSFRAVHPDWVASGFIKPLVQLGLVEDPYMAGVPKLVDYATGEEEKAVYTVLSEVSQFSRAYWVSPKVPADRVAILQAAFSAMARDPETLQDAAHQTIEIRPSTADDLAVAIRQFEAVTPSTIQHLRQILQ